MVTQTLTKPAEGEVIYARKATSGATSTKTWEALVDICNELAGRSGTVAFEAALSTTGSITLTQIATPSAPGASATVIYAKTDGALYYRSGVSGTETPVGGGGYSRLFLLMGG